MEMEPPGNRFYASYFSHRLCKLLQTLCILDGAGRISKLKSND